MRTARRYLVSGRVQGVGYRYFVLEAARREDLHG
ncbi:MAG: acylphosphatase, partial [Vicinamibacterales bacterium]